jgi:isoleucyl-tRNA synthetase
MSAPEKGYKATLSLPQTTFPMRGDLVKNEPGRLAKWEAEGLYQRIVAKRRAEGAPKFILHDGPPFANGDVHMGTALNKVLKDLVVKSRTMAGYEAPFIPGWDCHGLPIEFKVVQEARDEEPAEIRRRCEKFARGWIDTQRESFRRLGVFGDWENPYLTLDPGYEAEIIRVFATLVEKGVVYQSQKPVQWSYGAHTALAEAEVEYKEKTSPAIWVKLSFTAESEEKFREVTKAGGDDPYHLVIWTTTPWTLPANLGVALHADFTYVAGQFGNEAGERHNLVIAKDLLEEFAAKTGLAPVGEVVEFKGREVEGLDARHPFLDRLSKVILAQFVTTETGTGMVHIAPGHGSDDYVVGRQHGFEVISPVDDDGKFTAEVGIEDLVGRHVFDSNERIIEILSERGVLLAREDYKHEYPHCWRSKTPIIFRAVEQFFISLDDLRATALAEIDEAEWLPHWGRNRIFGTVESRPDWCISRQRTWGVPLPVFFTPEGEVILDAELARKVADLVEKEGTNIWFELAEEELVSRLGLPEGTKKCRDTLDVWIDSGCSHVAVLDRHPELHSPADLYLEATDQHRGWFQSSLMLSVGYRGTAPYKTVMTHGFVVDQDTRKKTSKSDDKKKGKPTDASYFYNKYGADILRLWVSSVDWQTEVPFGEDLFKQITEPYRRIRNTLRILLGNLDGFDPATDAVTPDDLTLVDRWILERLHEVVSECRRAYECYEFRKVFSVINQFCAYDLSAIYVDLTKDRLYCDAVDSQRRRASQTAMNEVFDALVKLLAPILAFTAEEGWEHAGREGSVHEQDFPVPDERFAGREATGEVNELLELRGVIQTAIQSQVQGKAFNKSNEASVELVLPADHGARKHLTARDFAIEFFIIADLKLAEGGEISASAVKTSHPMCPRCRRYEPVADEEGLCDRCGSVLSAVAS